MRRTFLARLAAIAIVLPALLPITTPAAPQLSADEILAREKAADKAALPASEIENWTFSRGGLTGTERIVRRGDDSSDTTTEGPFRTRRGSLGGKAWHQNENGYTIIDVAEPSQAARAVAQSVTHPAAFAHRSIVSQTLSSGLTERTFYDDADFVVVRREYERSGHVFHLDYSDFRPGPGGRRRAWAEHGADDHGNTYDAKLTSDTPGAPVDDSALAIPANARTLVEFPAGQDEVHLPASVDFGRIHVTVNVNGYPLTFLLDSGASGIFINPEAAKEIGLKSYGSSAMTVAGTFAFTRVIAPTVQVGSITMHDVVMGTVPLDSWETQNDRVVGLLGYDFIAGTALRITYGDEFSSGQVDAIRPDVFTAPPLATATMPVRLNQQVPVVHVGIGDAASDDFIVDTGAEAPIILFDRFVKAHPGAVADRGIGTGFDPDQSAVFGVGGRVPIMPLRLSSFRFADLDFKNFIVLRAANPGAFGDFRDDGLLGAFFLRYFTLYIDYPHQKLYFEPNDNHTRAVGHSLP
jgi:predicted aspartyl protease